MTNVFSVMFKGNVSLTINDIIEFEQNQIDKIMKIASYFQKDELQKSKKYGFPIAITEKQKIEILTSKHNLINFKSSKELIDQNIIKIGAHSMQRILERVGSTEKSDIIKILDRVKATDAVEGAQFKGFPTLSYTLFKNGDPYEYKFAISFILSKGNQYIKMVTVHLKSDEPEGMEYRIGENSGNYKKLADFKQHIIKELSNNC